MKRLLLVLLAVILVLGGLAGCTRAEFEVSRLTITPSQVVLGEAFTVSAEIKNVGGADGVYTAKLKVNGIEVATKDIAVASGATEKVSFTLTEETPGSYDIALNNTTASFTVLKLPSADEMVDGVIQSMYDVSTYQFDLGMTMDMAGEAEGEAFEGTMTIDSSGVCDTLNRLMRMEMIMSMTSPEEGKTEMGMEMYLIGNTQYILMEIPDTESMWVKSRMPVGTWQEITQVEPQIALLESAKVELIGSDKVRGVDCYVLQLTPDVEQLWQIPMYQVETTGGGLPDITEELIQEIFRSFSVKQWVEKDTYFLTKAEVQMDIELTPEVTGFPEEEGELAMDITMTLLAYNYNKLFSIELPAEAEEAISLEGNESSDAETELANIQAATVALMVDNGLSELPNPVSIATDDMSAFPDTSLCGVDKILDTSGNAYMRGKDKDGYLLYQHDLTGDGSISHLVNYVSRQYTNGTYSVDKYGTVTQVTYGY